MAPSVLVQIENYLSGLDPEYLAVLNESDQHAGHKFGGQDSHFAVTVVSAQFEGQSLVARHRMIYTVLDPCLRAGVHALKISTFTPEEWRKELR